MTETQLVVEPLRRQSVVHLAIEQIRRMISSGALSPGQRLPAERELAELFGVSRPTIREAIRVLGFSGAVETKQGSGSYVSAKAPDDLALDFRSTCRATRTTMSWKSGCGSR